MPSTPVTSASPETDARASTTWRLQPPSASFVLWRKPRNPPSVSACALDPGVDTTAAARPELWSRLPFTAIHRMVHQPRHLHGSSPSTLDACVPATKDQAHDHTARLTIHSSQPGVSTPHSSSRCRNIWTKRWQQGAGLTPSIPKIIDVLDKILDKS